MEPKPGEPVIVNPASLRVEPNFPTGGISIRTHLWYQWARAGIRQEGRAWNARKAGEADLKRRADHINLETEEAMLSITAVAHAFNALNKKWRPLISREMKAQELLEHVSTNAEAAERWREPLSDVFNWRGSAAHFSEESKPVVPHPLGTNVSAENAVFSPENATVAVDVMMDLLATVIAEPSPELQGWAATEGTLIADLVELRDD